MNKTVFLGLMLGFLVAFFMQIMPVYASVNINNCTIVQDLNVTGETYLLTNNITITPTNTACIWITASNVTLDCQGYTIDGSENSTEEGISITWNYEVEPDNVTIKNCIVQNFAINGINGGSTINSTLINNTLINNYDNIYFYEGTYNLTIRNNTIINAEDIGIYLKGVSSSEIFFNTINNNYYSIEEEANVGENQIYNNLLNTTNKNIDWTGVSVAQIWNTTRQVGTRIYSDGTEIGGNYWTNNTSTGYSDTCTDADMNGFCDDPYDVEADAACAAVADGLPACGNNTDWLPLSDKYVCPPYWTIYTNTSACFNTTHSRVNSTWYDQNECNASALYMSNYTYYRDPYCLNATTNISADCCPISTLICADNATLKQIWNTSDGISFAYESCQFGCDNSTLSCAPKPFEQGFIIFLLIVIIAIVGWQFVRWARR